MSRRLSPEGRDDIERRVIRSLLGDGFESTLFPGAPFFPPVDVYETDDCLVIRMEIAGMKRKDITVELERDSLVVRGRRDDASKGRKVRYHRMEIEYGSFERRVKVIAPVSREGITARYRDGLLEVRLPWRGRAKPGFAAEE